MSDELSRAYASAEQTPLLTIELYHSAVGYIRLVEANTDLTATLETGSTVTFSRASMGRPRPSQNSDGQQQLNITISGASNLVYQKIAAITKANRVTQEDTICTFREFLPSDLTQPAGTAFPLTVTGTTVNYGSAVISASYMPVTNTRYPKHRYFTNVYPGLKYV